MHQQQERCNAQQTGLTAGTKIEVFVEMGCQQQRGTTEHQYAVHGKICMVTLKMILSGTRNQ